jgi:hypothetical protein
MRLLSQSKNIQFEKRAFGAVAKGIGSLAKRQDFVGGLLAPLVKTYGGAQRAIGYGKQLPAAFKNPNATRNVLKKDKLFSEGAKNIQKGNQLRDQASLKKVLDPTNPLSYRLGRGLGAATIGAPIAVAPFTVPRYLGAASADPEVAKEYAKNVAYQRVQDRLKQFSGMSFLDRIQTAWSPERFTQNLESPEASSVYANLANNDVNNPGILKYLASFNPFMGSPESIINQKIRSEILRNVQGNKEASVLTKKTAYAGAAKFLNKVLKPAYNFGKKTRGLAPGAKLPRKVKPYDPFKGKSYFEGLAGNYALNMGKHPVLTPLTTLGTAYLPFGMAGSYQDGKQQVYDQAAETAAGLADLGFMEKFNQPGFMGGLGRTGMAVAPGMVSDMLLNQVRQSMFPEVNQTPQ